MPSSFESANDRIHLVDDRRLPPHRWNVALVAPDRCVRRTDHDRMSSRRLRPFLGVPGSSCRAAHDELERQLLDEWDGSDPSGKRTGEDLRPPPPDASSGWRTVVKRLCAAMSMSS